MAEFNTQHKAVLDEIFSDRPLVRTGKMFGYPAYYAGKKMCVCLYEDGVGIKLPEKTVAKLLNDDPSAIPFQPLGRPKMREWVQINLERSEDYRRYQYVFEESIQFVLAQQGITTGS